MNATRKLVALFAAAVLLIVVMVVASFQAFRQVETNAAARLNANDLMVRAEALLRDLSDAEAGQLGYVHTGGEAYLKPYLAVRDLIPGQLRDLRRLTADSDAQKPLEVLAPKLDAALAHMRQTIELRDRNAAAAIAATSGGVGKNLMDPVRAGLESFIELDQRLLAQRDAEFQASLRRLFGVIVTASLFTLLFAVLFVYLIYRDAQGRVQKRIQIETQRLLGVQEELNRELQEANGTLRLNEEKLSVTLNSIGDAVITTDASGRVTLLNPLAEILTGWSREEAAGRSVEEVFHIIDKDTRQPSPVPVMETLAKGTEHSLAAHTILVARNGSESTVADSCAPIRERDGRVVGAVLVFRDVTNEDVARQALRDQQFYTRSLIESNVDALMTTDPEGIITDANTQMEALTGCTRDELIGSPFKKYFTDPARAEAGIKLVLREKKVSDYELTARARDGRQTAVSYNATTIYDRNRVLQGVFAAARDVTERKRLDQALQDQNTLLESARALADKANLAKSDFLSNMSHELRTPLSAILGFAQLMESGSPSPTASQKRSIDQILKAGWYLLDLINEILDLALIESGKLPLSLEPISLSEVVQECHAMVEPQALQRGIGMTFPQFKLPYYVQADRTRVKQVLINLLSNGIKYNRAGGTLVMECLESTPGRIRVCVRDSGEGLTTEKMAQLFEPFNRLGQESGIEQGTGIGLVVSKRLVERMGGAIGVESTIGKGSVFWIELNLTAEPQAFVGATRPAPATRAPARTEGQLRTLLYVEDNPANLMLVEDLIARRPEIHLLVAMDGVRGVEIARASLPDVILMDINLPGISGIKALKMLAEDAATAGIPIIALSANAMPDDIEKGLEAGFFRYLTKPIKVNEFMDTLDMALDFAAQKVA